MNVYTTTNGDPVCTTTALPVGILRWRYFDWRRYYKRVFKANWFNHRNKCDFSWNSRCQYLEHNNSKFQWLLLSSIPGPVATLRAAINNQPIGSQMIPLQRQFIFQPVVIIWELCRAHRSLNSNPGNNTICAGMNTSFSNTFWNT